MKKQEIYVPIANKKEAKRAKAVLEAMGEVIDERYFKSSYDENEGGLYFNEKYKTWVIAISFRHSYNVRTKTTLKQLIELLVSEHNQAEPEKIAVRVDNEKEFNALMKYYDGLGWKSLGDEYACKVTYPGKAIWTFEYGFGYATSFSFYENYKIIPFSEFAKDHGLRVPLLVSEDGVELFEGNLYFQAFFSVDKKWEFNPIYNGEGSHLGVSHNVVVAPDKNKAFSTKQAALDWIEAQKPKVIEYKVPNSNYTLSITKEEVSGFQRLSYLDFNDIKAIHKAMEGLNS